MPTIVPAILEQTPEGFNDKAFLITRLPNITKIHVDFADGKFVPNTTLPVEDFDSLNPAFEWEAHLMLSEVKDFLDYKIAGFKTAIIHFEAFENNEDIKLALQEIKKQGMRPALAINPDTEISVLDSFTGFLEQITVMSVHPGFQGAPFEESVLKKIEKLKAKWPDVIIEIDGSVNETTIKSVSDAGADLMVVGSAIVKSQDPLASLNRLLALI